MKRKKYKAFSVCLLLCMTMFPVSAFAAAYTDIAGHRDEQYIISYSDLGLVNGYPDGTFRPDEPITRAEVTALLGKLKLPAANGKQAAFSDVSSAASTRSFSRAWERSRSLEVILEISKQVNVIF